MIHNLSSKYFLPDQPMYARIGEVVDAINAKIIDKPVEWIQTSTAESLTSIKKAMEKIDPFVERIDRIQNKALKLLASFGIDLLEIALAFPLLMLITIRALTPPLGGIIKKALYPITIPVAAFYVARESRVSI